MKKLFRSNRDSMIAGICGGIAEYYNLDVTVVRMGVVLAALFIPPIIVAYLIGIVIIPEEETPVKEEVFSASMKRSTEEEIPEKLEGSNSTTTEEDSEEVRSETTESKIKSQESDSPDTPESESESEEK